MTRRLPLRSRNWPSCCGRVAGLSEARSITAPKGIRAPVRKAGVEPLIFYTGNRTITVMKSAIKFASINPAKNHVVRAAFSLRSVLQDFHKSMPEMNRRIPSITNPTQNNTMLTISMTH